MLRPFNCPKSEEGWAEADQHMAAVVVPEVISATSVEEKNLALCRGIYSFFSERYGYRRLARQGRAKVTKQKSGTSLEEIKGQRNKLRNDLRRARKDGQDTEAIRSLASKFHKLLCQYSAIKRDQHRASERDEAEKQRRECARDFPHFAKKILDDEGSRRNCEPQFDGKVAQRHFEEVYSAGSRSFSCPSWLPAPPAPAHPFDEGPIGTDELLRVVKRSKLKSSPSPRDQITYLVLRRCPALHHALLDLFNLCWVQHCVPRSWKEGVVRLIAKPAAVQIPMILRTSGPLHSPPALGRCTPQS